MIYILENKWIKRFGFSVVFLMLIFILFILPLIKEKTGIGRVVEEIKNEYRGVIIKKYSVRDTPPTHLKIKLVTNKFIRVSPNNKIVDRSSIGDSIIKPKNENFVYLITPNGHRSKFYYTKISNETRSSEYFPCEWRNKWMESSE